MKKRTIFINRLSVNCVLPGLFLSLFILSTLFQGCKSSPPSLIFAYQDRIADALSIIAVEKEFFKDQGLIVEAKRFHSGPECTESLIYGDAVIGTMGDTAAIIALSRHGDRFKLLTSHGGGEKRHRIIVGIDSKIQYPKDLVGKKIGVKFGTSTHGGLMLFAKKYGLDLKDALIDMAPSLQLTALAVGELDAIVASEPTPSLAVSKQLGRDFVSLGDLGNTYPICMLGNVKFIEKNPGMTDRFFKALAQAALFVRENPGETAKILSRISGLNIDVIEAAMANHYYTVGLGPETLESLETTAKFLLTAGKISQMPDFTAIRYKSGP